MAYFEAKKKVEDFEAELMKTVYATTTVKKG
jgi:hypothetical protein